VRLPSGTPTYRCRVDALLSLLPKAGHTSVLEIGCGSSTLGVFLAQLGFRVTVCDINYDACEYQKTRAQELGVSLQVHHGQPYDVKGRPYDVLIAFEVLEHLPDDMGECNEWTELVKDGGLLYFSVPAHPLRWSHLDDAAGHLRRYTRERIFQLSSAVGLTVESLLCYGFPLANIGQACRKTLQRRRSLRTIKRRDQQERTALSGIHLPWAWVQFTVGSLISPIIRLQRFFYRTELGPGYLWKAIKGCPPTSKRPSEGL